jgi:hypothetical protein
VKVKQKPTQFCANLEQKLSEFRTTVSLNLPSFNDVVATVPTIVRAFPPLFTQQTFLSSLTTSVVRYTRLNTTLVAVNAFLLNAAICIPSIRKLVNVSVISLKSVLRDLILTKKHVRAGARVWKNAT